MTCSVPGISDSIYFHTRQLHVTIWLFLESKVPCFTRSASTGGSSFAVSVVEPSAIRAAALYPEMIFGQGYSNGEGMQEVMLVPYQLNAWMAA